MSDFSDYLMSQANPDAGASFSTNAPRPYVTGVSQNVLGGTVNTGSRTSSVDTELLSHPGGTHGHSLAGSQTVTDTASVQQAAMSLYGLHPDEVKSLQQRLVAAGYLKSGEFIPGVKDGATAKAYGDLLQETSAMNMAGDQSTLNDVLGQRAQGIAAQGVAPPDPSAIPNGRVQQITPGLDLESLAQQAAQNEYGRKLKPAELQKFVAVYHGMENAQNSQVLSADAAAQTGGNSTIVEAPNASTAATAFVDNLHPAEAQAHSVAGQFTNLLDILKGI